MPTTDFMTGAVTRERSGEAIGANSTTTGRSFDAIFGMALRLLKSPMKELKSGMTGEICAMIDGKVGPVALVGGGKRKVRSIS